MITESFSSNKLRTNLFFRVIAAAFGLAVLTLLASCSTTSSTNAPQLADATVVEVEARETESQYVWNDAEISGHVDVVDKFGKTTQLTTSRRLVLSEGATVRLAGNGLQGVSEAEVWVLSTPRLLNKIPVNTNGSFSAQIMVPTDLEAGNHTVLISATMADGRVIAVNIPAFVPSVVNPTPTTIASATIARPRVTTTTIARPQTSTTVTATTTTTVPATTTTTTTIPVTTTTVPVTTTTTTTTTTIPAATYTVTYNSNTPTSGTAPTDAVAYANGATVTVLGNTGSLAKTGFSFGGWCTTQPIPGATCSETARAATSTFTITSDITLYAVWTTNTQTITYARGTGATGTHPSSPVTVLYGSTFTTPANPYTRAGWTFAGWSDGTTTVAAGSTYPASGAVVTSNVTLTATWTALTYSITYYDTNSGSGNGGDGGTAPAAQTGSGVASLALNSNTLVLDGYGFYGWTATNGSTTVEYTNAQAVSITSNTTLHLYPVWGARTFGSQIGLGANNGQTNAAALQSDGKMIIVGTFTGWNGTSDARVVRLQSDGTYDPTFNTALGTGPAAGADRVLVQTDDKVVISGSAATWSGSTVSYRIVRLNSDGSLDTAFNTNIGTGPNNNVFGYAQQSDGKLIIVGSFTEWNGSTVGRIVRLNTDGTIDTTFSTNVGTGATQDISRVNLQTTGKLVVTGSFTSWNGSTVGRIVRLNTDGTRDTAFSTNAGTGFSSHTYGSVVQSDDKIVVAGNFASYNGTTANRVLRLNADGTLDTAFSTNIGAGPGSQASRVALQSNGQILVAQGFTTWAGTTVGSLIRLNTDGTRDTAFTSTIGTALIANQVMSMTAQSSKVLIMGSFTSWNGTPAGRIVRLNADGTID